MTENEVIEKLEFFKKAIINLKNELNDKDELIEDLSTPPAAAIEENLQARIEELEKQSFEMEMIKVSNEKSIKELEKKVSILENNLKEEAKRYELLKEKAGKSIKHLVEDIIEPKEKEQEEISNRISDLEKLLFEKNKDHKMIVKSAEKELQEMLNACEEKS